MRAAEKRRRRLISQHNPAYRRSGPTKFQDLTWKRFGKLIAEWPSGIKGRSIHWLCRCDCGTLLVVAGNSLRTGNTKRCIRHRSRHGYKLRNTPEHNSWNMMLQRCTNPKARGYKDYGGRGIKVCARWKKFDNFLADMGRRPKGTSLDRFPNPNGNYEKRNCRWATRKQQQNNRRKSR